MWDLLNFGAFAKAVEAPSTPPALSWCPLFLRLVPQDVECFRAFCRRQRLIVLDALDRQLEELAKIRFPSTRDTAVRENFISGLIEECGGRASYGTWIYLPWEAKVVHLLDQDAYFEIITNRNQDKITKDEQRLLRTKRIGVMGLSVGGEAAITVAQEHLCGEIVLADFDLLDLSNLNRLNGGFDELGLKKTTVAARRIVKIDPYLRITVFDDGVTEENIDKFLCGLHLLLEECDDLEMKFQVRRIARERGLNIVYAGDERGFLSIEPYAIWPELRVFHGGIDRRQPPRESFSTPLALMKALTEWLGGWDNISERSRRSLEKIGDTLCGYPQLASEARYAAAQIGYVARRLLLGEHLLPFQGNLDLDTLIQ